MIEIQSDRVNKRLLEQELDKIVEKIDEVDFKNIELPQNISSNKHNKYEKFFYEFLKYFYRKLKYLLYKFNLVSLETSLENIVQKIKRWRQTKGFKKSQEKSIAFEELLAFQDKEFISYSYKKILQREVDPEGLEYYLHLLRSGKKTRGEIIAALRYSQEGKKHHVNIKGLSFRLPFYFLYKIPIIGYVSKILVFFLSAPKYMQRYNIMENQIFLTQQSIVQTQKKLKEEIKELDKNIRQDIQEEIKKLEQEIIIKEKNLQEEIEKLSISFNLHKEWINKEIKLYLEDIKLAQKTVYNSKQSITKLLNRLETLSVNNVNSISLKNIKEEKEQLFNDLYLSFENYFRGDEEKIKQRQKVYLPFIKESLEEDDLVIDIGCGRGEWLSLLQENNIKAKGVELNKLAVEILHKKGLDVVNKDALSFLSSLKDNSIGAISAFHLVEHLEFFDLVEFLQEVYRVLKKGGILILETPNPENILVGSCSFYVDPTHKNPIPSQTLEFLVKHQGFKKVKIQKLNPLKAPVFPNIENAEDINLLIARLATEQDYAVIGYKDE